MEMTLVSNVTAPFRARARPLPILAPVVRVMLVSARIFPWNRVEVPSVAELPTRQYTLQGSAPLIRRTTELLAVVSVLPIRKTNLALASLSFSLAQAGVIPKIAPAVFMRFSAWFPEEAMSSGPQTVQGAGAPIAAHETDVHVLHKVYSDPFPLVSTGRCSSSSM
jgi:hypothetical protein